MDATIRSLSLLIALSTALVAQGKVHVVEPEWNDRGAVGMLDLFADGTVESQLEISDVTPGIQGLVPVYSFLGSAVSPIGDLDGNGALDLAVGAYDDSSALFFWAGEEPAVWIFFRAADGSLIGHRKIRSADLTVPVSHDSAFGGALAWLGDLDGDGATELAIGAPGLADTQVGEVRIVSLASDASVVREVVVGTGLGGFAGALAAGDRFGSALTALGDRDGDGIADLGVGAMGDDDGGDASGALWLLHLNADATVASELLISRSSGGLGTGITDGSRLGSSVCVLGDLDGDGVRDLAVGAYGFNGYEGAVWILVMNVDGTVRQKQRISHGTGGLSNPSYRQFGAAVAPLGDMDGDGTPDLAVGAPLHLAGALFVLFLQPAGTVGAQRVLTGTSLGLSAGSLASGGDTFGSSLATLGDLDLDGRLDIVAGARRRDSRFHVIPTMAQAAIDAASQGDTILLRWNHYGTYGPALVDGKSLTIVGDGSTGVRVSSLTVRDLASSQTACFVGLRFSDDSTVTVSNNDGTVWIEECEKPADDFGGGYGVGLSVGNSADVVVIRSSFAGGSANQQSIGSPGFLALSVQGGSSVYAYESTFLGGAGVCSVTSWDSIVCGNAGPAVKTFLGTDTVFLSGCTVRGGDGDYYSYPLYGSDCCAGATGVLATGPVSVLDSDVRGGSGAHGCMPGQAHSGSVAFLPGASLALSPAPLVPREGEDVVLSFRGPPGAEVWLMGSPVAHVEPRLAQHGFLLLGTPRAIQYKGTLDASGALDVPLPLGLIAPSWDVRRVFLQPLMIEGARPGPPGKLRAVPSRVTLGAGSAFVVLDNSF